MSGRISEMVRDKANITINHLLCCIGLHAAVGYNGSGPAQCEICSILLPVWLQVIVTLETPNTESCRSR